MGKADCWILGLAEGYIKLDTGFGKRIVVKKIDYSQEVIISTLLNPSKSFKINKQTYEKHKHSRCSVASYRYMPYRNIIYTKQVIISEISDDSSNKGIWKITMLEGEYL